MAFWKRKNWDEKFDENYGERSLRERPVWQPRRIWPHVLTIFLTGVLFAALAGAIGGQAVFEKTLVALAQPTGLIWIALMVLIYFTLLFRNTAQALIAIFAWLILTIAGNGFVANWLATQYEADYQDFEIKNTESLDAIFLLGGGTATRSNGSVQLGGSGDRIAMAARLYHAGKVKTIICTGSQSIRTSKDDLHPREEAARLLADLGVPELAIQQLKGDNTAKETDAMKAYLEQNPKLKRVGVLTSAWHLPRAMRLLKSKGIEATPLPSNFLSGFFTPTPDVLIPSPHNLDINQSLFKEYLASFLGR